MATTTSPATPRQINFIHVLLKQRQIPVAGETLEEAFILERCFDVMGQKDISFDEAGRVIDYLKARPYLQTSGGATYQALRSVLDGLPPSFYGYRREDGVVIFYEVVTKYRGKAKFINRVVGGPGDWRRYKVGFATGIKVCEQIAKNPTAAAKLFADTAGVCSRCLSPLSDTLSVQLGLGTECRKKV